MCINPPPLTLILCNTIGGGATYGRGDTRGARDLQRFLHRAGIICAFDPIQYVFMCIKPKIIFQIYVLNPIIYVYICIKPNIIFQIYVLNPPYPLLTLSTEQTFTDDMYIPRTMLQQAMVSPIPIYP
jgi:hypothetical protein